MPNRERSRRRSSESESTESFEQPSPFEVGETTLDLDDISDEELESLYFDDDGEDASLLNLPTITGFTLILAGIVYLLSELGVWTGLAFSGFGVLPWLVGVGVILLGFGLLTWRPSRLSDEEDATTKKKAVEAETGKTKVVEEPTKTSKKLTRSRTDKKLMGVCGGIAEYLNLDPTLVRIAFVVGIIGSGASFVLAYIGLAIVMPKESPLTPEERLSIIRNETDTE